MELQQRRERLLVRTKLCDGVTNVTGTRRTMNRPQWFLHILHLFRCRVFSSRSNQFKGLVSISLTTNRMPEAEEKQTPSKQAPLPDGVEQHLQRYIAAFNAADLETVKGSLAEHLQIFVEENLAGEGRDAILPFYEQDFQVGKQVHIHKPPRVVNEPQASSSIVAIAVGLTAVTKDHPTVSMDVVYTYDTQAMVQIRHDIRNVVSKVT
eukprot:scaffold7112_cov155-Amphora_coffeaeformis.AAC.6